MGPSLQQIYPGQCRYVRDLCWMAVWLDTLRLVVGQVWATDSAEFWYNGGRHWCSSKCILSKLLAVCWQQILCWFV